MKSFACKKQGHLGDQELGCISAFSAARWIVLTVSTPCTQNSSDVLTPPLSHPFSSSWQREENHRKWSFAIPAAIGSFVWKDEPTKALWVPLVAKHSDDGQLMEEGLRRDQRVCFCTKHHCCLTHVNVCVHMHAIKGTDNHQSTVWF